jgi:hypothetical protein
MNQLVETIRGMENTIGTGSSLTDNPEIAAFTFANSPEIDFYVKIPMAKSLDPEQDRSTFD